MNHEFKENWQQFTNLVDEIYNSRNDKTSKLVKRYIEQNIQFFNEMLGSSIENLTALQKAKSATEVICTQAKFAGEINRKMAYFTKCFLDASLGDVADYNEWLKAHCDLATD